MVSIFVLSLLDLVVAWMEGCMVRGGGDDGTTDHHHHNHEYVQLYFLMPL